MTQQNAITNFAPVSGLLGGAALVGAEMIWTVTATASQRPALAQQQIDWCVNASDSVSPDQQMNGCTAAIKSGGWSGKNLAWTFNNRE